MKHLDHETRPLEALAAWALFAIIFGGATILAAIA
jgi:hypothetical protein